MEASTRDLKSARARPCSLLYVPSLSLMTALHVTGSTRPCTLSAHGRWRRLHGTARARARGHALSPRALTLLMGASPRHAFNPVLSSSRASLPARTTNFEHARARTRPFLESVCFFDRPSPCTPRCTSRAILAHASLHHSRGPKPESVKMNLRYSIIRFKTMVEGLAERLMKGLIRGP